MRKWIWARVCIVRASAHAADIATVWSDSCLLCLVARHMQLSSYLSVWCVYPCACCAVAVSLVLLRRGHGQHHT